MFSKLVLFCTLCSLEFVAPKPKKMQPVVYYTNYTRYDFGIYGPFENCPNGSYARGFQLKVQPMSFKNIDNEAVTGIRIFCATTTKYDTILDVIKSKVGSQGEWGNKFYCRDGFMVGIETGTTIIVTTPVRREHLGIINVKFACSNKSPIEGDGGSLFGISYKKFQCPTKYAICGLQSVIHEFGSDHTGLNNMKIKCCPVQISAMGCNATDSFETILVCDNLKGKKGTPPFACVYERSVGVSNSTTKSSAGFVTHGIEASLGFEGESTFGAITASVMSSIKTSAATGVDWAHESENTFTSQKHTTVEVMAPPGKKVTIDQVVAECGAYDVSSPHFKVKEEEMKYFNKFA